MIWPVSFVFGDCYQQWQHEIEKKISQLEKHNYTSDFNTPPKKKDLERAPAHKQQFNSLHLIDMYKCICYKTETYQFKLCVCLLNDLESRLDVNY